MTNEQINDLYEALKLEYNLELEECWKKFKSDETCYDDKWYSGKSNFIGGVLVGINKMYQKVYHDDDNSDRGYGKNKYQGD